MASPLSFMQSTSILSPSFRMPDVFVVPPEEDKLAPYCCFDATQPKEHDLSSITDIENVDSALDLIFQAATSSAPIFRRDMTAGEIVMPRRSTDSEASTEPDYEDYGQDQDITIRGNEPGDDSEVIEVIKVKTLKRQSNRESRSGSPPIEQPPMKRSKTFISRASKAFRSIKNLNKSSRRPSVNDVFASSEPLSPELPSPTPHPSMQARTLSRRGSVILSQFFASPSLRSTASFDSMVDDDPLPSLNTHLPGTTSTPCLTNERQSSSHPYDNAEQDRRVDSRAPSPAPSSLASAVPRRRFSVMNLFSFSSSSVSSSTPSVPTSVPTMSRDSFDPSSPSTASYSSSSSAPGTPADTMDVDVTPKKGGSSSLFKGIPSFAKKEERSYQTPARVEVQEPTQEPSRGQTLPGELSFEMRLDSLHFDEISFDIDRF